MTQGAPSQRIKHFQINVVPNANGNDRGMVPSTQVRRGIFPSMAWDRLAIG